MLRPNLRSALRQSLDKLALVGRFSHPANGFAAPPVVALSNGGHGAGAVSVTAFFEKVRPQLRLFADSTTTIGTETFNRYRLRTPAEAGATGEEQYVLPDSPLFDAASMAGDDALAPLSTDDRYQKHQKRGAQLYRALLGQLDVVVRFSHPNFARGLLVLARQYAAVSCNAVELDKSAEKVDIGKWEEIVSSDQRVGAAIIRLLTGYGGDLDEHLAEFRRLLNEPARSRVLGIDTQRVEALSFALKRLKRQLASGPFPPVEGEDATLANLWKSIPWLKDYADSSEFCPPKTSVDITMGGARRGDLLAFYRTFCLASDAVHRFVRTAALHPFVFAWLASKYQKFDTGSGFGDTAIEMFRVGVEGQRSRVYGETADEKRHGSEYLTTLHKTSSNEAKAADLEGDSNYTLLRDYGRDSVYRLTTTPTAFMREALRGILEDLFALMYGMTSDIGKLMEAIDTFNEAFRPYYQAILSVSIEGRAPTLDDYRTVLSAVPNVPDHSDFVDSMLRRVPSDPTNITRSVKDAFLAESDHRCDVHTIGAYVPLRGKIALQEARARRMYKYRVLLDVSGAGKVSGLPSVTVTSITLEKNKDKTKQAGDAEKTKQAEAAANAKQNWNKSQQAAAKGLRDKVTPSRMAFSASEEVVGLGLSGEYEVRKNDTVIGSVTVTRPSVRPIVIRLGAKENAGLLLALESVSLVKSDAPDKAVGLTQLNLQGIDSMARSIQDGKSELLVQTFPLAETIIAQLALVGEYVIQSVDGIQIGTLRVPTDSLPPSKVEVAASNGASPEQLLDPAAGLYKDKKSLVDAKEQPISLVGLKLRGAEAFNPPELADGPDFDREIGGFESAIRTFTERYTSDDTQPQTEDLRRAYRAMVLGEYMLAAPGKAVNLDVDDLSQGLGLMVDVAKNIGTADPRQSKFFGNTHDSSTSERLPKINLSRLYPVASSGEMQTILQYQLDLCDEADKVREYLSELQEIKQFLTALSNSKLDIIVVNQTLQEHASLPAPTQQFFCQHRPASAYLTRQAFTTAAPALGAIKDLGVQIARAVPSFDLVVPVLITPVAVEDGDVPLPVIGRRPLPSLIPCGPGIDPGRVSGIGATLVTSDVPQEPYLLLAAGLSPSAASARYGNVASQPEEGEEVELGKCVWHISHNVLDQWRTDLNIEASALGPGGLAGQPLARLFHMAWSGFPAPGAVNPLFNLFLCARMLNLAIAARRSKDNWLAVRAFPLVERFGQLVQAVLLDEADAAAARDRLDEAFKAGLQAATLFSKAPAGNATAVTNNTTDPLTNEFRVQRAAGAPVDLLGNDWKNLFAMLLPDGA